MEASARIQTYREHNIAFIARPKDNRPGLFKKASNMNYAMNISVKVAKLMADKGISHDRALAQVS